MPTPDTPLDEASPPTGALPPADFRTVAFAHPHERAQFDFFRALNHPHFGLVATVDVARLRAFAKTRGVGFNQCVVYAIARAANEVPDLRRRVRETDGEATCIEHAAVHPSYALAIPGLAGFSFCTVSYSPDFETFVASARATETRLRHEPSFADEPGRDDYLYLSAIPWVHFTGIQHAMGYHPTDSVPRISWGKVLPEGAKALMPVSVQAHHAVADGRVLGEFYWRVEALLTSLEW